MRTLFWLANHLDDYHPQFTDAHPQNITSILILNNNCRFIPHDSSISPNNHLYKKSGHWPLAGLVGILEFLPEPPRPPRNFPNYLHYRVHQLFNTAAFSEPPRPPWLFNSLSSPNQHHLPDFNIASFFVIPHHFNFDSPEPNPSRGDPSREVPSGLTSIMIWYYQIQTKLTCSHTNPIHFQINPDQLQQPEQLPSYLNSRHNEQTHLHTTDPLRIIWRFGVHFKLDLGCC